jgi:hypothetical protein
MVGFYRRKFFGSFKRRCYPPPQENKRTYEINLTTLSVVNKETFKIRPGELVDRLCEVFEVDGDGRHVLRIAFLN